MIRTRGKHVGEHLTLIQFCNDWISADDDWGNAVIVTPTSVQLEEGERELFWESRAGSGTFFKEFWLNTSEEGVTTFIRAPKARRPTINAIKGASQ
jgi:DNA phosphorothioation-dependent restriction protein DptG